MLDIGRCSFLPSAEWLASLVAQMGGGSCLVLLLPEPFSEKNAARRAGHPEAIQSKTSHVLELQVVAQLVQHGLTQTRLHGVFGPRHRPAALFTEACTREAALLVTRLHGDKIAGTNRPPMCCLHRADLLWTG